MQDKFYKFRREKELFALQLKEESLSMKIKHKEEIERRNNVVRREREKRKNLKQSMASRTAQK